jgi:CRP/FNR family cyclic AMP-dependent transcriptional regulator
VVQSASLTGGTGELRGEPRSPVTPLDSGLVRMLGSDALLAGLSPRPPRLRLDRGACLTRADAFDWLFVVVAGRLRLSRITATGRKLDLDLAEAPTFFLAAHLTRGMAQAIDHSELRVLTKNQVETLSRRPELSSLPFAMAETFGNRLVASEDRLEYLAYHSVTARVALALLRLRSAENGIIDGITHQEIGDIVGAYRETVTKVLHHLQDDGHIQVAHRRIKVRNPTGLAALLEL